MAVDGTYNIVIDTPMGKQESKITFKTAGTKLSGVMENEMGKAELTGSVKGNDLLWSLDIESPMGNLKLDFKGKIAGDEISGEAKAGNFGHAPFKGKKV